METSVGKSWVRASLYAAQLVLGRHPQRSIAVTLELHTDDGRGFPLAGLAEVLIAQSAFRGDGDLEKVAPGHPVIREVSAGVLAPEKRRVCARARTYRCPGIGVGPFPDPRRRRTSFLFFLCGHRRRRRGSFPMPSAWLATNPS